MELSIYLKARTCAASLTFTYAQKRSRSRLAKALFFQSNTPINILLSIRYRIYLVDFRTSSVFCGLGRVHQGEVTCPKHPSLAVTSASPSTLNTHLIQTRSLGHTYTTSAGPLKRPTTYPFRNAVPKFPPPAKAFRKGEKSAYYRFLLL